MLTADPPAIVAPADDGPVIEVVATRPDQAQKIDRRIYRVKDNPHAAQSDTLQLLRGLPAVVVTPDDQLLLLGSAGVTILIDERPYQGDAVQYLRTLHGSDIERIEIITNPSAQYAAQGTGGIINIVLRKKRSDGVSGSGSVLLSSFGRGEGSATWKSKKGKWTYELRTQDATGRSATSSFQKLRTIEQNDGSRTINSATGNGSSDVATGSVGTTITYDMSPRSSLMTQFSTGTDRSTSVSNSNYVGLTPDFASFAEAQRNRHQISFENLTFMFDHKSAAEGETLKASLDLFNVDINGRLSAVDTDGGGYSQIATTNYFGGSSQIDWNHPIGKTRILSLGARIDALQLHYGSQTSQQNPDAVPSFELDDSFLTRDTTFAAYATYQQQIGKWSVLPGLRVERFDRSLMSPAQAVIKIERTNLFPTLHVDRPLGKDVTLSLSYAKRIDRPDPRQLRPYPILTGALALQRGNPALRDQTTDSYEINLHYHHKSLDLSAILYDRETSDLFDVSYSVDAAGNSVSTPVNAGHKSDRGAEIDATLPLLRRVKGTASVNLFDSVVPLDALAGPSRISQFRYTVNATIDWQGKEQGRRPGDVGQVQLVYQSPTQAFQFRYSAYLSATLSYTHSLSRSVALTGSVENIGARHSSHRLEAPTVQEDYDQWQRQPELKLKLVKTLGTGKT